MNKKKTIGLGIILTLFILGAVFFMFKDKLPTPGKSSGGSEMPAANAVSEEITKGTIVSQTFRNTNNNIKKVEVVFTRLYDLDDVNIAIELVEGNNTVLKKTVNVKSIRDQHRTIVEADSPITGLSGKDLTIRIYPVTDSDTGVALMINDSENTDFSFGSKKMKGTICFCLTSE